MKTSRLRKLAVLAFVVVVLAGGLMFFKKNPAAQPDAQIPAPAGTASPKPTIAPPTQAPKPTVAPPAQASKPVPSATRAAPHQDQPGQVGTGLVNQCAAQRPALVSQCRSAGNLALAFLFKRPGDTLGMMQERVRPYAESWDMLSEAHQIRQAAHLPPDQSATPTVLAMGPDVDELTLTEIAVWVSVRFTNPNRNTNFVVKVVLQPTDQGWIANSFWIPEDEVGYP